VELAVVVVGMPVVFVLVVFVFVVLVFVVFVFVVLVFFVVFVVFVLVLVFVICLAQAHERQVGGQVNHHAGLRAADQVAEELGLQTCAVGEQHRGVGQQVCIARRRLKRVRIRPRRHEHGERDQFAADAAHDVADDVGGRDHQDPVTGRLLSRRRAEQPRQRGQREQYGADRSGRRATS
ncbi:MAG: hypothetical protein OXJ62_01005, partial [Spirochaetaceae bacterium]|nr:hypothetical protein [Spirochaetaceae bacterium]